MIVKVQRSIFSTEPGTTMLVYNKSRSIMYEEAITPEIAKALGKDLKGYFRAELDGSVLTFGERVPAEDW